MKMKALLRMGLVVGLGSVGCLVNAAESNVVTSLRVTIDSEEVLLELHRNENTASKAREFCTAHGLYPEGDPAAEGPTSCFSTVWRALDLLRENDGPWEAKHSTKYRATTTSPQEHGFTSGEPERSVSDESSDKRIRLSLPVTVNHRLEFLRLRVGELTETAVERFMHQHGLTSNVEKMQLEEALSAALRKSEALSNRDSPAELDRHDLGKRANRSSVQQYSQGQIVEEGQKTADFSRAQELKAPKDSQDIVFPGPEALSITITIPGKGSDDLLLLPGQKVSTCVSEFARLMDLNPYQEDELHQKVLVYVSGQLSSMAGSATREASSANAIDEVGASASTAGGAEGSSPDAGTAMSAARTWPKRRDEKAADNSRDKTFVGADRLDVLVDGAPRSLSYNSPSTALAAVKAFVRENRIEDEDSRRMLVRTVQERCTARWGQRACAVLTEAEEDSSIDTRRESSVQHEEEKEKATWRPVPPARAQPQPSHLPRVRENESIESIVKSLIASQTAREAPAEHYVRLAAAKEEEEQRQHTTAGELLALLTCVSATALGLYFHWKLSAEEGCERRPNCDQTHKMKQERKCNEHKHDREGRGQNEVENQREGEGDSEHKINEQFSADKVWRPVSILRRHSASHSPTSLPSDQAKNVQRKKVRWNDDVQIHSLAPMKKSKRIQEDGDRFLSLVSWCEQCAFSQDGIIGAVLSECNGDIVAQSQDSDWQLTPHESSRLARLFAMKGQQMITLNEKTFVLKARKGKGNSLTANTRDNSMLLIAVKGQSSFLSLFLSQGHEKEAREIGEKFVRQAQKLPLHPADTSSRS